MPRRRTFSPFESRGRLAIGAILATIAVVSIVTVVLSIRATQRAQHKASVVQVASRQQTLAQRYVNGVLLAAEGRHSDPVRTGKLLAKSADALLSGGVAPAVPGDDDESQLGAAQGSTVRKQLVQERRLVDDLTRTGNAMLAGHPTRGLPARAGEDQLPQHSVQRLRVLAALTSNVSLNAAGSIATAADDSVNDLIGTEMLLGGAGLLISLTLALALVGVTRRQTARFRSLVASSTDLVLVFGGGGCRYASDSVSQMLGCEPGRLLGEGFFGFVSDDDEGIVRDTCAKGDPGELVFRVRDRFGEWRHLEARVTDMRNRPLGAQRRTQRQGRDRADRARGGTDPPGVPRRPHRVAEPRSFPGPAGPGIGTIPTVERQARGLAARPRWLQAGERQPRARRGRPPPPGGCRAARRGASRRATPSPASAAMSSPSCSRAPPRPRP